MKILVVRFSSIGDIVLTTPVVRTLHEQLGAEVHFLTKKGFASILVSNPHIAKVWTIEKKLSSVLPALKAEGFDAVIDLHHNLRTFILRQRLGVKRFYCFDKLNFEKWLLVKFKINRLPQTHIVERYLAAAAPLDVKYDGKGLDYFIPTQDEVELSSLHTSLQAYNYTALVVGAAHATKRPPIDVLQAMCKQLPKPIVVLGGKEDRQVGEQLANGTDIINACGAYNLNGSASLLRQSKQVIAPDTGLMHIAAALRKDIKVIWGSTVPEFGMYPFLPEGQGRFENLEVKDLGCRPCSKIGFAACPKGHFKCMRELDLSRLGE